MTEKLNEKILKMNFGRVAKKFIVIAVLLAIVGIVASAIILQPRLSEIKTLRDNYKQSVKSMENIPKQQNGDNIKITENGEGEKEEKLERDDNKKKEKEYEKEDKRGEKSDRYDKDERLNKKEFISQIEENITPFSIQEKIVLGSVVAVFCILFIVYKLLIVAWLYQASNRANVNAIFWVIASLFFDLIAVVVFIVWRKCFRKYCDVCHLWQRKGQYCPDCGSSLQKYCSFCNAKVKNDDKYCKVCGKPIEEISGKVSEEE